MLWNLFVALVIIGVVIGLLVFLLSRVDPESDTDEKKFRPPAPVRGDVPGLRSPAPPMIYADGWPETMTSCPVVFIKSPKNLPDRDQHFRRLGEWLLTFQAAEDATKEERIIANVFESQIGYHTSLRLPDRIASASAYTVAVKMKKSTWPAEWRPESFFDIKVVFDGPLAGTVRANHIIPQKYRDAV